jgi:hypothetical protein
MSQELSSFLLASAPQAGDRPPIVGAAYLGAPRPRCQFPHHLAADRVSGVMHRFPIVFERMALSERCLVQLGLDDGSGLLSHLDHYIGVLDPLSALALGHTLTHIPAITGELPLGESR